ncbi:efflux RND transporter periplasmic adaptor subunit [Alicyclobacillaceae bacterium I2511]|nr:efflux RND transporter periplasmic adaptor subunit [Alicyclobacillaceae bacterium I2511]
MQAAEAAAQTATAGVQAAQAQLHTAQVNESYAVLRAPVDGVITQRNNSIGDVVAPGQSVFSMDVPHLQVYVAISETELPYVKAGEPITMTVAALPGRTFTGHIFEIDPAPIPGNMTEYRVKATLQDTSQILKPGMNGNVTLHTAATSGAELSIPTMSLQQVSGVYGVYVMGNNPEKKGQGQGQAPGGAQGASVAVSQVPAQVDQNLPVDVYFQPVEIGYQGNQYVEVTSGLHAGEKILLGVGRFISPGTAAN